MTRLFHLSLALSALLLVAAASSAEPPKDATNAIDAAGLLDHIKILGSDKFEGRAPGSKGEEESVS
ncbi:MAG: peptidase M20, partial [Chthoniobacterales bacterium]